MTASKDEALVTDLARAMFERIVVVDPDQAAARPIFTQQAESFLADPGRALAGKDRRGNPLEFGLTGMEVLLVPVLMQASVDVIAYLSTQGLKRGATASVAAVRRLFGAGAASAAQAAVENGGDDTEVTLIPQQDVRSEPEPVEDHVLTAAQWAEVARIVKSVLVRHARMTPDRAELFATAVVGEGVLGRVDHDPR